MSFAKSVKGIVTLALNEAVDLSVIEAISDRPVEYVKAGDHDTSSIGLIRFPEGDFVKEINGLQIVNVGQSVKKVNKKKVKRLLKEKIAELSKAYEEEKGEPRKFSKDEKDALAADIAFSLLPETEVDEFDNLLIVDSEAEQVYVVNTSKKASESITSYIRDLIESFPVAPVVDNELAVIQGFAEMANDNIQSRLSLGNYIKLEDADGVVVWTKESLYESQATDLIETGKQVVAIGLEFDGIIKFVVDTEFTIKGLKWDKQFNEKGASFEADVLLCFNEIRKILKDLKEETKDE